MMAEPQYLREHTVTTLVNVLTGGDWRLARVVTETDFADHPTTYVLLHTGGSVEHCQKVRITVSVDGETADEPTSA